MTPIKFVFFGTPEFSVIILDELLKRGLVPGLVVTTPNRPKGRGLKEAPSPVRVWSETHNIPCITPEALTDIPELRSSPSGGPWDMFVVCAYGTILPSAILTLPTHGALNVHPSILPKYRGASPIEAQILADEEDVGVTIMCMDEEMDHGPILASEVVSLPSWPIRKDELSRVLATEGGRLLADTMLRITALQAIPQDHEKATFTKKIRKEDGEITFTETPYNTFLQFCAYHPWPGSFFFAEKDGARTRIKIIEARFSDGIFLPTRVVPEGRKEVAYRDLFSLGYLLPPKAPKE